MLFVCTFILMNWGESEERKRLAAGHVAGVSGLVRVLISGYMTDFDFKKHQKTDNKKKRHGSRQGREMDSESARLAKEWRCVASIAGIMHRILITNL